MLIYAGPSTSTASGPVELVTKAPSVLRMRTERSSLRFCGELGSLIGNQDYSQPRTGTFILVMDT